MLDALLRGDLGDGSRLWECAAALRLPHHGTFVVVAAKASRPGIESIPHAEEALRTRGVQSAWRVEVDAHVGVVVLTPRVGIDKLSAHLADLTSGPVGFSELYPAQPLPANRYRRTPPRPRSHTDPPSPGHAVEQPIALA